MKYIKGDEHKVRRRTFDALVSGAGLLLVALLLVAGGLLTWAHAYAGSQVSSQLGAQKIVFPTTSSASFKALPKADQQAMGQYAGQPLTTGAQAKVYADNYIAVHLNEIGKGQTYSQLSAESMAQPGNAALKATVDTVFKGTTLRSMLLEAYGFGTFAQIALYSAIASFIGAALFAILSVLGFVHLRRTSPDTEILPKVAHPATA
jgi:hypothetical protein